MRSAIEFRRRAIHETDEKRVMSKVVKFPAIRQSHQVARAALPLNRPGFAGGHLV